MTLFLFPLSFLFLSLLVEMLLLRESLLTSGFPSPDFFSNALFI